MTQRASLDLLHELAEELGAVGGTTAPKAPKGPRKPTMAELKARERRNAELQAFAETMRPHVEPLVDAGYGTRRIARALNEAGIRNHEGGPWGHEPRPRGNWYHVPDRAEPEP